MADLELTIVVVGAAVVIQLLIISAFYRALARIARASESAAETQKRLLSHLQVSREHDARTADGRPLIPRVAR